MKTAHTPGPWKTVGKPNALGTFTVFHGWHRPATYNQVCQADTEANAKLIAAAPDMHAFIVGIIDDQYDRVSPGIKHEARRILASINGGNP